MREEGFASLRIRGGRLDVSELTQPGFGGAIDLDWDTLGAPGLPDELAAAGSDDHHEGSVS
jgi:hypothetical protein